MRKFLKTLFVLTLCICVGCVAVAEEQKDIKEIGYDYAEELIATLAQRAVEYAPEIKTLDNGVQVQRTPAGLDAMWHLNMVPISYNNYYLNADNRGCASCHDLGDLSHNLKDYPHPSLENELGIEPTLQMCLLCHEASGTIAKADRFGELMHQSHNSSNKAFAALGGDCWSCHYATDLDGGSEMKLWDDVKHQVLRGITSVASEKLDGTFSWNQDKVVGRSATFTFPWMARRDEIERQGRQLSGIEPNPETDGIYDTWTITVNGDVENPTTKTINEWIEAIGLENATMTQMCVVNPMGGPLISNNEITGLSIEKMIAYCTPKEGANAFVEKAWSSWNAPEYTGTSSSSTVGFGTIKENGGYLALEIGGEPLEYEHGYPVEAWIGGINASYNTKEVREITVVTKEEEPTTYTAGNRYRYEDRPYINVPNIGIAQLAEGQIIPVGEPHVFEGYAFGLDSDIAAIEISFDKGATWISYDIEGDDKTRWVWWNYEWTPPAEGAYTISVRATSSAGSTSAFPVEIMFNAQLQ